MCVSSHEVSGNDETLFQERGVPAHEHIKVLTRLNPLQRMEEYSDNLVRGGNVTAFFISGPRLGLERAVRMGHIWYTCLIMKIS